MNRFAHEMQGDEVVYVW